MKIEDMRAASEVPNQPGWGSFELTYQEEEGDVITEDVPAIDGKKIKGGRQAYIAQAWDEGKLVVAIRHGERGWATMVANPNLTNSVTAIRHALKPTSVSEFEDKPFSYDPQGGILLMGESGFEQSGSSSVTISGLTNHGKQFKATLVYIPTSR